MHFIKRKEISIFVENTFIMKTLQDFNFKDKKAIIRVDFNVPLNDKFEVTDATRIEAAKSTLVKILEDGGSCVLLSHLGRPKGFQDEFFSKSNISFFFFCIKTKIF